MEKINIAELLKDCPTGTKLYSPLCGECYFDRLNMGTIICKKQNTQEITFTSEGYYMLPVFDGCECVLFPSKENRDWSKWGNIICNNTRKILESNPYSGVSFKYNGHTWGMCARDNGVEILVDGEIKERVFLDNKLQGKSAFEVWKDMRLEVYQQASGNRHEPNCSDDTTKMFSLNDIDEIFEKIAESCESESYHWTINDAKDGDVLATSKGAFIYNGNNGGGSCPGSYCGINTLGRFQTGVEHHWTGKEVYPATKEQSDFLFQKIKEAGYEWNPKTKTLKKLPKFKVGDRIKKKGVDDIYAIEIAAIGQTIYTVKNGGFRYIKSVDKDYELVSNKFDITTLKPFDKVLVRADNSYWRIQFFERINKKNKNYPFVCMNGYNYKRCIPYEGNEHLLYTANDCDDYFKM